MGIETAVDRYQVQANRATQPTRYMGIETNDSR